MSLAGKTLKVCSCNRTVGIDVKALAAALKSSEPLVVHDQLCRRDAAAFQSALGESEVIVACTHEATLFGELAEQARSKAEIRFVNVREHGGWGARCNACVRACPENAIGYDYQVDLDKCKAHRNCVDACGAIGAIDFSRADKARSEKFDMVLDLSRQPALRMHQLPQGYRAPGDDPLQQALAAQQ